MLFEPQKQIVHLVTPEDEACNILFIGVDWDRKGGDVAYKTFLQLRKEGFRCKLFIVGCKPPRLVEESAHVEIVPFLHKRNNDEYYKLFNIYLQAHFLILPTRADCTPIVFSEAAAFGIPVLTTDTGGISTVIHDDANGFLLPAGSDENSYCKRIRSLFEYKRLYDKLRVNCRNEYETRLSWKIWSNRVNDLISKNNILNFNEI